MGSYSELPKCLITLCKSHETGSLTGGELREKDRIRLRKTESLEISGSFRWKTELSMERYPLVEETESFFLFHKYSRKSATFGTEGLDEDTPVCLHQALNTPHLC